jgi:hypothetical protein
MKIITIIILIIFGFHLTGAGQPVYFNKHFSLNGKFTAAVGIQQANGTYIIAGQCVNPTSPSRSIGLFRFDLNGNLQTTTIYGDSGINHYTGHCNSYHNNSHGGSSLATSIEYLSNDDSTIAVFYKFDQNLDTVFYKKYHSGYGTGNSKYVGFYNHSETMDQGFAMIGIIHLPGSYNQGILVVRTDSLGNELWRKVISTYNRMDIAYNIINTPDSGFVIGAYQYWAGVDFTGNPRVYKLDKQGNLEWTRTYGSQWDECAARVILTRDTNIMVVYGEAYMLDEPGDPATALPEVAIVKVSLTGQQIWKRNYRQYHTSIPNAVTLGHDGYVIAGWTFMSDTLTGQYGEMGFVLKIDENGDSIWWRNHWNQPIMQNLYEQNKLYDVTTTSDGGYIACGETSSAFAAGTLGYQHAWVLKMDEFGCQNAWCTSGLEEIVVEKGELKVFPNPAKTHITITYHTHSLNGVIQITDATGKVVLERSISGKQGDCLMDVQNLKSGLYLVQLRHNNAAMASTRLIITH